MLLMITHASSLNWIMKGAASYWSGLLTLGVRMDSTFQISVTWRWSSEETKKSRWWRELKEPTKTKKIKVQIWISFVKSTMRCSKRTILISTTFSFWMVMCQGSRTTRESFTQRAWVTTVEGKSLKMLKDTDVSPVISRSWVIGLPIWSRLKCQTSRTRSTSILRENMAQLLWVSRNSKS